MPKIISPSTFTDILTAVAAGLSIREASKSRDVSPGTVSERSKKVPEFRAALDAALAQGKTRRKVAKATKARDALVAVLGAPAQPADALPSVIPAPMPSADRRPTEGLRALFAEPALELIHVGELRDGQLFMSPTAFDRLFAGAMGVAQRRAASRA